MEYEQLWSAVGGRDGLTQWYGDPRRLWPSEARHFVPWLIDNLGLLSRCLALPLTFVDREVSMGSAQRADILATDDAGRRIVIEAQIGSSDNNHLGKLPVYGLMGSADLRPDPDSAIPPLVVAASAELPA